MDINSNSSLGSNQGVPFGLAGSTSDNPALLSSIPGIADGGSGVASQFVKGINFNGGAIAFGEEKWLSQSDALRKGLNLSAYDRVQSDLITDTSVGKSFRDMLNSGIQTDSAAGGKDLEVTQSLADGTYQVDLFMTAPVFQDRRFSVELEGKTVDRVTLKNSEDGRWSVYSYEVTVTDGSLDLVLEKEEKSPLLSGLRVSSLAPSSGSEGADLGGTRSDSESTSNTQNRSVVPETRAVEASSSLGINFNGGAIAYADNERWLSQQDALRKGLTLSAYERITTDLIAGSSVSGDVRSMLSTGIQSPTNDSAKDLEISQTLDNGEYWVDLFITSPTQRERIFEVEIEGKTLEQVTLDEDSDGTWDLYSYKVDITDGELNVVLDKTRKSPVISGMRISPVAGGDDRPLSPEVTDRPSSPVEDVPDTSKPSKSKSNSSSQETDPLTSEAEPDLDVVGADIASGSPGRSEPLTPASNPTNGRLVWAEDFGSNWETSWPGYRDTSAPENRQLVKDSTGQFDDVLRVSYRDGGVGPSDGTQFKVFLDKPMQSATLEYYVRFKPGFLPVRGGKLPGFVGGGDPERKREFTGGRTPSGLQDSGWSSRLGFRPAESDPTKVILRGYTYLHKGQQDPRQDDRYVVDAFGNEFRTARQWNFGTTTPFLDPDNLKSELIIETGEWYKVALQVQLNTPGQKNGFLKGFIQEPGSKQLQLAMHVPDLSFQKKGANLPIDRMFFSTFFGGSADSYRAQRSEYADFAGFKIYDNSK